MLSTLSESLSRKFARTLMKFLNHVLANPYALLRLVSSPEILTTKSMEVFFKYDTVFLLHHVLRNRRRRRKKGAKGQQFQ